MKKLLFFVTLASMSLSHLFALGPHLQLYAANRFAERCENMSPKDILNLSVGVMFPDIWCVAKDRPDVMKLEVTPLMLKEETRPFYKGVLLYYLLCEIESEWLKEADFYKVLPRGLARDDYWVASNMAEDHQVFHISGNIARQVFSNIVASNIYTEDEIYGYSKSDMLHWFMSMLRYFMSTPIDTFKNIQGVRFFDCDLNVKMTGGLCLGPDDPLIQKLMNGQETKDFVVELENRFEAFFDQYNEL